MARAQRRCARRRFGAAPGRWPRRRALQALGRGQGSELGGQASAVDQTDLRLAAHRIADYIYEKLTGDRGVFSTRIAYVTTRGGAHAARGRLRR